MAQLTYLLFLIEYVLHLPCPVTVVKASYDADMAPLTSLDYHHLHCYLMR